MKKLSLLFCFILGTIFQISVFAQSNAICSAPGITLKYKRTIVHGSTVTVHFTLTNNTGENLNPYLQGEEGTRSEVKKIEAFDDEGNYYDLDSKNMSVSIAKAVVQGSRYAGARFSFPNEVTVKGVITFRNVSEYALSFIRIAIPLRGFDITENSYQIGHIILKDIPISRDL